MNLVLPILFIIIFFYSLIKKVPAYDYFVNGSKDSVNLVISFFPYLCAIFIFVELMDISGVSDILCNIFAPILKFFGIPTELSKLIILRPFSGNG
ncbi:MAG: spore maturation protein, partial [Christensenellales bacterium]